MKNLKENSIHIPGSIVVCWTCHDYEEEVLDMTGLRSKLNGAYSANNSTICYIVDHEIYVTPYTREAMSAIREAGLVKKYFYVPFSNGDFPKHEQDKWLHLRSLARESYYYDYEMDCIDWCDKHGVGKLSEETLQRCFKIPREGVRVKHLYFENTYFPVCDETYVDCTVIDQLGTYCTNNGKVVFVYRNGHTYVTKGYKIISELESAGYKKAGLFVPFSNGEQIIDHCLASQWECISKN